MVKLRKHSTNKYCSKLQHVYCSKFDTYSNNLYSLFTSSQYSTVIISCLPGPWDLLTSGETTSKQIAPI